MTEEIKLDAEEIKTLILELRPEERQLFQAVLLDVLEMGNSISDFDIKEMAKKYADKARKLAGTGGDQ